MYFTIMESPKKIELVYIIDDCFPLISKFPELLYPFQVYYKDLRIRYTLW